MRAAVVRLPGGPEVFRFEETPLPETPLDGSGSRSRPLASAVPNSTRAGASILRSRFRECSEPSVLVSWMRMSMLSPNPCYQSFSRGPLSLP
jgi:hypothetical protein